MAENQEFSVNVSDDPSSQRQTLPSVVLASFFVGVVTLTTTIVGYPSLRSALVDENVFAYLCDEGVDSCSQQSIRLDRMFTISIAAYNTSICLVCLFFFEKLGWRISHVVGCIIFTLGSILFGLSLHYSNTDLTDNFGLFEVGFTLFGIGSSFLFMSLFCIPNFYHRALAERLLVFLLCGEDTSAAVFLIFGLIYEWSSSIRLSTLFFCLAVLPFLFGFLVLWLPQSPVALETEGHPEQYQCTHMSFWDQVRSIEGISLLCWCAIQMPCTYFYVASLHDQLLWISNNDSTFADTGVMTFGYLFVLEGTLLAWLFGKFLNHYGSAPSLCVVTLMTLLFSIFSIIKSSGLQYLTLICFTGARACMYSMWGHFCNVLMGKNNAKFIGATCLLGSLTTYINYVWLNLSHGDYLVANVIMGSLMLLSGCHLIVVLRKHVIGLEVIKLLNES